PNGTPPPPFNQLNAQQRAFVAQRLGALTAAIPLQATTPGTLGIPDASARGFRTVSGPVDIKPLDQTITQTVELGYKGLLANKVLLAVDGYYTNKKDFIGPLSVESPLVYLERLGADLANVLTPILQGAAQQDPQLAALLAAFGGPQGAAQQLGLLAGAGFDGTPVAVVQPDQPVLPEGSPSTEVGGFLSYRNFGDVDYFGADVSLQIIATEQLSLFANASFVSDDFFDAEELSEDNEELALALNAPATKFKVGGSYRQSAGLAAEIAGRYIQGFPVKSGPYVGDVDDAFLIDLNVGYDFQSLVAGLRLDVGVSNLLDDDYRQFIGAPRIGRMAIARLTYTTP
ncbi:MAG: TonB-dependent receptor, partial [Rhodothermales bacterium]|nr:TonB-dependent receptor [Rhodothermales bacterium]